MPTHRIKFSDQPSSPSLFDDENNSRTQFAGTHSSNHLSSHQMSSQPDVNAVPIPNNLRNNISQANAAI